MESLLQISSEVVGLIVSQLLFISDLGVGALQIFNQLVFFSSLLNEVTLEDCVAKLRLALLILKITCQYFDSLIEQIDLFFEISNFLCCFFFFLVDYFLLIVLILGIVCSLVRLRVCLLLRFLYHRVESIHWSNWNSVFNLRRELNLALVEDIRLKLTGLQVLLHWSKSTEIRDEIFLDFEGGSRYQICQRESVHWWRWHVGIMGMVEVGDSLFADSWLDCSDRLNFFPEE